MNKQGSNLVSWHWAKWDDHGGKASVKKWHLSRLRNVASDVAVRTWRGKEFQSDGAAISNEQSKWLFDLWVLWIKTGILRNLLSGFDRRVYRLHEYSLRHPAKYGGWCVLSALYVMTNSLNFTLNSTGNQWSSFRAFEVLACLAGRKWYSGYFLIGL